MKSPCIPLIAAAAVAVSLTLGLGATPAQASGVHVTSSTVSSVSSSQADESRVVQPPARTPSSTPNPSPAPQRDARGIPIGPIVNFLKSAGPSIWNGCVKAVKAGSGAFAKWWNGLASWIRTGVLWITEATVQQLFQWLLDWVTHH